MLDITAIVMSKYVMSEHTLHSLLHNFHSLSLKAYL